MLLIRSSASERSSKLFKSIKMCFPKSKSFAFPKCLQRSFASWRKGKGGVEKSKTTHSWIVSPFLFCGWTFKCLSSCVFWIPARLTQLCITPRSKISVLCSLQCLVLSDKRLKARSPLLCVNSQFSWHTSDTGLLWPAWLKCISSCFLSSTQSLCQSTRSLFLWWVNVSKASRN